MSHIYIYIYIQNMDSIDTTIQYKSHNPMCPVVAPKFNNLKCSPQDFLVQRDSHCNNNSSSLQQVIYLFVPTTTDTQRQPSKKV